MLCTLNNFSHTHYNKTATSLQLHVDISIGLHFHWMKIQYNIKSNNINMSEVIGDLNNEISTDEI